MSKNIRDYLEEELHQKITKLRDEIWTLKFNLHRENKRFRELLVCTDSDERLADKLECANNITDIEIKLIDLESELNDELTYMSIMLMSGVEWRL